VFREDTVMTLTDDLRKTLTDPTPLYFAAGTADLALQQAKRVPELVEQLRAEAPARIEAVRRTDPKEVQAKATARAKDLQESVQNAVTGVIGSLDTDLKKLGESAQGLALRGVGVAFEYAVRARETYEKVAEHGEQAVKTWRSESPAPGPAVASAPEPRTVVVKDTADEPQAPGTAKASAAPAPSATARKAAAKKTTARRNGAKKTTPPAK
jgi:heparin binding hemagglutinin HbhA